MRNSNSENLLLIKTAPIWYFVLLQEEDELDSGTMVRAAGDEMGTVRVASTMSDGANTMIEHDDTLASQLGTMVINAEDEEEEGTMKSKALRKCTHFSGGLCTFQGRQVHAGHTGWLSRHFAAAARTGCKAAKQSERGGEAGRPQLWGVGGWHVEWHRQEASATRRDLLLNLNDHSLIACCHFCLLFLDRCRQAHAVFRCTILSYWNSELLTLPIFSLFS